MKVLQVTAPRESVILDLPVPEPKPGEVLMKVDAVATCPQWDLHLRHNEPMFVGHQFHYPYMPGQPGHEATGTIGAVGDGETEWKVGDRVSAWRDAGHDVPGCYAQYVLKKSEDLIRFPSDLPLEKTASLELAMCVGAVFLLLNEMNAVKSRRFGVMGLGAAGMVAAQMARAEGAVEVVGFDFSASRRDLALSFAVDEAYDPREDNGEKVPMRGGSRALMSAVDCVGAKASVEWLMDRTNDVVALFGVQREDYTFAVRHYMNLRLCGYRGHSRAAADYAAKLINAGMLDLSPMNSISLPLERYDEGIELLESQKAIKILFKPWE